MEKILEKMFYIMLYIVFMKVIIGWHWNWEKCDCCGKTWREIRKKQKGGDKK